MSPSRGVLKATHTFASLTRSRAQTQIYLSLSNNPHLNLSLEHHLFTTLPATTRTLLLYINTPSIIIGRNQNPWLETSHPTLMERTDVQLLRRRSGGGTVFHDLGNANYSVTVPTSSFDRDTHAHMMVRALRSLGVSTAAVNARHDIVIADDKKVSGSAYKLTRHRSYHHGTMLLSTDLSRVSTLLRSPAKHLIEARGVASVPSPVTNIGVPMGAFIAAAAEEFEKLYGSAGVAEVAEEEAKDVEEIREGMKLLGSEEWVYGQTPRFTMTLPWGEVVVDKGIIVGVEGLEGEGVVGCRFGGEVAEELLVRGGMMDEDAEKWADEMVGGLEWGKRTRKS